MIRRTLAAIFLLWAAGFLWFAMALPQPLGERRVTDAVIVLTGGAGRIPRGLEVLEQGLARELLVTGVDPEVKPEEFATEFGVPQARMACCVTLGATAVDTRGNAAEAAIWVKQRRITSLRLVTTDWHMRRAAAEFDRALPDGVEVVSDAVPSHPELGALFLEYHKLIARWTQGLLGR